MGVGKKDGEEDVTRYLCHCHNSFIAKMLYKPLKSRAASEVEVLSNGACNGCEACKAGLTRHRASGWK